MLNVSRDEWSSGSGAASAGSGEGGGPSGDVQDFWERWGPVLFAVVVIGLAVAVAVWIAGGGLRGWGEASAGQSVVSVQSAAGGSQSVDGVASGGVSPVGDVVMSGGYEVGADGKLLRPKDAPIPVPPVKLDIMEHETPEGMEDFARYVAELIPYTWMSGDVSKFESICLPESSWCKDIISSTQRRNESGGWVSEARIKVVAVSSAFEVPDRPHLWHIELQFVRPEMTTYNGATITVQEEDTGMLVLQALYEDSGWKVSAGGK